MNNSKKGNVNKIKFFFNSGFSVPCGKPYMKTNTAANGFSVVNAIPKYR